MKLALISDLHGQSKTIDYIEDLIKKSTPDAIIISGDITSSSDLSFLPKLFKSLEPVQNIFLISGNADSGVNLETLEASNFSINGKCKKLDGIKICGLSYPEETPLTEDISDSIFVTHRPPVSRMASRVLPNAPKFHISGHLHKAAFVKKYPSTTHIQVPTLQDAKYAILDTDAGKVEFKEL